MLYNVLKVKILKNDELDVTVEFDREFESTIKRLYNRKRFSSKLVKDFIYDSIISLAKERGYKV